MRLRLKGIASATKKLADGTTRKYFYAWRGGPLLPGKPGTAEFIGAFNAAIATKVNKPVQEPKAPPTIQTLIDKYKASSDFPKNKNTARNYELYLKLIEAKFGAMPIAVLEDPRIRGDFKEWRDTFADKPRKADYIWQTLARVFSYAKDNGRIKTNPCERGGRIYKSDRKEKVWEDVQINQVLAVAPPHLALPVKLAEWTGQREGDLINLQWSAYDGQYLSRPSRGDPGGRAAQGDSRRHGQDRPSDLAQLPQEKVDRGWVPNQLGQADRQGRYVRRRSSLPRSAWGREGDLHMRPRQGRLPRHKR